MKKINLFVLLLSAILLMGSLPFSYADSPKVICIDPGHQEKGNYQKEPIGPGSKIMKNKVAAGTRGVSTKKPEYVLTLEISNLLKTKLEAKGFKVIMIRDKHAVNISNRERAEIANKANADLFLRIHADGSDNAKASGISTLYPSPKNPYVAYLSKDSKRISQHLVNEMALFTGAVNRGAVPRDDMSGINWCKVPVSIVETGFMTNSKEDKLLSDPKYQEKLVNGMVNAILLYFQ